MQAAAIEPELSRPPLGDDVLYEVIDGKIVEIAHMGAIENRLASFLLELIGPFARANKLGVAVTETLFVLNRKKKLQRRPDVAYVSYKRWPRSRKLVPGDAWDVVPDLAIEVISPSNTADQVIEKIGDYFDSKCRGVWVVYPKARQFYVYESPSKNVIFGRGDLLPGEPTLPGFQLDVSEFFDM